MAFCCRLVADHFTSNETKLPAMANKHYNDVIMSAMAPQILSLTIVYSTVYKGADQRKHQSSASLAFVRRIHRWPVNSPHKGPVTRKMFPFDDVIMEYGSIDDINPLRIHNMAIAKQGTTQPCEYFREHAVNRSNLCQRLRRATRIVQN